MGKKRTAFFTIFVTLVFLSFLPQQASAIPFYYQIQASYLKDDYGYGVEATLYYGSSDWGFDVNYPCTFNISIDMPENSILTLNLSKIFVFIDFYFDFYVYTCENHTDFNAITTNSSRVVYSQTFNLLISSHLVEQNFIPEAINTAVLGFLVVFDASIIGPWSNTRYNQYLYSYRPEGENWPYSGYLEIPNNNADWITIHSLKGFLNQFGAIILSFVVIMILVGASFYIHQKLQDQSFTIGGRTFRLRGIKVPLAYLIYLIDSDCIEATSILSHWTRTSLGLELPENFDLQSLTGAELAVWREVEGVLSTRAAKIAMEVVQNKPIESRGPYLVKLAQKKGINIDARDDFIRSSKAFLHYQQIQWSRIGREAGWGDIEESLSSLDPSLLEQHRSMWETISSRRSDRKRQAVGTARELLTRVLRKWGEDRIEQWEDKTRKEKLRIILESKRETEFVESFADFVDNLYDLQSRGWHEHASSRDAYLVVRLTDLIIRYILTQD